MPNKKWTVMVWMAGDNNLQDSGEQDLRHVQMHHGHRPQGEQRQMPYPAGRHRRARRREEDEGEQRRVRHPQRNQGAAGLREVHAADHQHRRGQRQWTE